MQTVNPAAVTDVQDIYLGVYGPSISDADVYFLIQLLSLVNGDYHSRDTSCNLCHALLCAQRPISMHTAGSFEGFLLEVGFRGGFFVL